MKLSVQAPVTLVLALNLISCSEPVSPEVKRLRSLATEISTSPVLSPTATVDGVSNDLGLVELRLDRPVASAGEKVVVLGKGLQAGMEVEMSDHKIPIVLTENNPGSVSGTFTFPSGLAPGQILVQIRSLDRVVAQLPIIHDAGDYPLVTAGADKVCAGERFRDANGNLLVGTRPCPFFEPCRAEGQSNCLIANDFILVDRSNLLPGNIKQGIAIGGVLGTALPSPAACMTDGQQNCVASGSFVAATTCAAGGSGCYLPAYSIGTQPLRAISYDDIEAGKGSMRTTLTLGGISGTLADCTANFGQNCFTTPTYRSLQAQCQSTNQASCESDVSCQWNSGSCEVNPWNIRTGVSIAGQTGRLKTNCRNTIYPTYWDASYPRNATVDPTTDWITLTGHGFAANDQVRIYGQIAPGGLTLQTATYYVIPIDDNTFKLSTLSGPGTAVDITSSGTDISIVKWQDGTYSWWDTGWDYGFSSIRVSEWSNDTLCDSTGWRDVTTINGGQTFASCGTGDTCIYKDLISGLFVTGILASGGNTTNTTTPATYHWAAALQACATSTYGGYPAGSWRLPTQKETIALYVNGLASIASTNFNIFTSYTWTASTGASTGNGFVFSISIQAYSSKSNLFNAFCVK